MIDGRHLVAGAFCAFILPSLLLGIAVARDTPTMIHPIVPTCPASYSQDGLQLTKIPKGWVGEVYDGLELSAVSVVVGDQPLHDGEIIPLSKKIKGMSINEYTGLGGFPKSRWLLCGYGSSVEVRLYQQLDNRIQRCVVYYRPYPGPVKFVYDHYQCK